MHQDPELHKATDASVQFVFINCFLGGECAHASIFVGDFVKYCIFLMHILNMLYLLLYFYAYLHIHTHIYIYIFLYIYIYKHIPQIT